MNGKSLDTAVKIIDLLITVGIPAGEAIYRSVKAVLGPEMTEPEMAAALIALSQDAHVRGELAKADAAGNG